MQAVHLRLQRLRAELDVPWSADGLIDGLLDELNCAIAAMRDVSDDLRPQFLERLPLVDAIRLYCGLIASRSAIRPSVSADHDPIRLADDVKLHCFLGVRLALENAVRHARATRIDVLVETLVPDYLSLRVLDDGVGFDTEHGSHRRQGLGLRMIHEYAETVLGHAHVQSRPGLGTVVEIVVPLGATPTPVVEPPAAVRKAPRNRPEARRRVHDR
jgi:signal transduction histidine kinase